MYTEGSLGCGRTVQQSRGAAAVVVPADGCVDVILHGDDIHLAGPSTVCIPASPDIDEIIGVRFGPGLTARVLRFSPAEVRDLATPLRDVIGAVHTAEVAQVLRTFHSSRTAPKVDLLTPPANGQVGLVRHAVAARAGATQVTGETGQSAQHLRRRVLTTFGYGCSALVRAAWMRRTLSLMGPGCGSPTGPAATRWLSRATMKEQPKSGPSLAAVTHAVGYADQVHMTRDFRFLVGRTPARVAGSRAQGSIGLPSGS